MAEMHRFFYPGSMSAGSVVTLESDTAKHIWQVLRMEEGDKLTLTNGKGTVAEGTIQLAERHKCNVLISDTTFEQRLGGNLHLCVAFTKNNGRNEWLLEKATELGAASITPLITARYNKTHIRHDRWEKILQSAILQSRQAYLPELNQITKLADALSMYESVPQRFVAHCIDTPDKCNLYDLLKPRMDAVILIGPEGDFTRDEVDLCISQGYLAASLGRQRLRTETAAITAAAYFNILP